MDLVGKTDQADFVVFLHWQLVDFSWQWNLTQTLTVTPTQTVVIHWFFLVSYSDPVCGPPSHTAINYAAGH